MHDRSSKYQRTLAFNGGVVGLNECLSATREAVGRLVRARVIRPLEIMFNGGSQITATLEDDVASLRASGVIGRLWQRVDIRAFRAQCIAATNTLRANGAMRWDIAYVREMLKPFPTRGQLDGYLEGMGDEGHAFYSRLITVFHLALV